MKFTLFISLLLGQLTSAQNISSKTNFYLRYAGAGLGSNMGTLEPTLRIQNKRFTYTREQNSYFGKRSRKKEFICSGSIRQSSIDSILALISDLHDSTVYKTNPCIMSGGVTYITIANGVDTTRFILHNTSDYVVLKIVNIINPYLPKDEKLYESVEDIKNEEECWKLLRERKDKAKSNRLKAKHQTATIQRATCYAGT